jgi:hypothetical protein
MKKKKKIKNKNENGCSLQKATLARRDENNPGCSRDQ